MSAPAIRLRGHALEKISNRGGVVAGCTCGETLSPRGRIGQSGRLVDLGIFSGPPEILRQAIRDAHEFHKAAQLAANNLGGGAE